VLPLPKTHNYSIGAEARVVMDKVFEAFVRAQMAVSLEKNHESVLVGAFLDGNDAIVNPRLAASVAEVDLRARIAMARHGSVGLPSWDINLVRPGILHSRIVAAWVKATAKVNVLCLIMRLVYDNRQRNSSDIRLTVLLCGT
jgi:hypothetical protein